MNVLQSIIGLPHLLPPRQAVGDLDVRSLAVRDYGAADRLMGDIGKLGDHFGFFFLPDDVRRLNPLARGQPGEGVDLIAIDRAADLQAISAVRLNKCVYKPGTAVVDVADIASARDHLSAEAISATSTTTVQIQSAGGHGPLQESSYKTHRDEAAAELGHL